MALILRTTFDLGFSKDWVYMDTEYSTLHAELSNLREEGWTYLARDGTSVHTNLTQAQIIRRKDVPPQP